MNQIRYRFQFFPSLMILVWLLSACQAPKSNLTEGALSSPPVFCDGQVAWSAEVITDDLVDYATFWIAFEAATAYDSFQYIHVDVTFDGEPLLQEMKYRQAAEPYSITCTDSGRQFEASRVKYTLFLPALPPGEHTLLWKYTLPGDLSVDAFPSPSGMTAEYEIKLNIPS